MCVGVCVCLSVVVFVCVVCVLCVRACECVCLSLWLLYCCCVCVSVSVCCCGCCIVVVCVCVLNHHTATHELLTHLTETERAVEQLAVPVPELGLGTGPMKVGRPPPHGLEAFLGLLDLAQVGRIRHVKAVVGHVQRHGARAGDHAQSRPHHRQSTTKPPLAYFSTLALLK